MEIKLNQNQREILAWLGGIISSDGSITKDSQGRKSCSVSIFSIDKKWIFLIKKEIKKLGLTCSIYNYKEYKQCTLHFNQPRRLYKLFKKMPEKLMKRKFKRLEDFYENPKQIFWTKQETDYLLKNYKTKKEFGQKISREAVTKLAKEFNVSRKSIVSHFAYTRPKLR